MFTLLTSLPSPYGRKVRIVIDCLGLTEQMRLQAANTVDPDDPIREINPLGKIPALIPEGGQPVFDSRVIVDYLENTYGDGTIIPRDPQARSRALTLAALAEGINDALIAITYEARFREPEQISSRWLDHQRGKLSRSLPAVIEALDEYRAPGIAATTLACALSYADWRRQIDWRGDYPVLADWLNTYAAQVPGFDKTAIPADAL